MMRVLERDLDDASVRSTAAIAIDGQRRLTASAIDPPISPRPTMAMRVKGG